jgi:transposase
VLGSVSHWVSTNGLVTADLWEAIQPLLPPEPCTTHGGPPRVPHRSALAGILYVLRHGLRWRDLPRELGYGSGSTCWRRLRQWQEHGVWRQVHQVILNWLGDLDGIDWSRASLDSLSVRAKRGGDTPVPTPPTGPKRARSTTVTIGVSVTAGMTRSTTGSWVRMPECTIRLPAAIGAQESP